MSLSKEAIELLMNEGHEPREHIVRIEDGTYWEVNNEGSVRQLSPRVMTQSKEPLALRTLTGLVDYIKSNLERTEDKLFLHVKNNDTVELKGMLDIDGSRETLVVAEAVVPTFRFDTFHPSEDFLIALNARFVDELDRKKLIAFSGNVKEDNARQTSDDGFSQKTTVKRGISQAGEEIVPNPVRLAPYRTFLEVEQPDSDFVFRMKEGPLFGLFEADGGAWKNQAIQNIETYLREELEAEINKRRITILA